MEEIFLNNKYSIWYYRIIDNARKRVLLGYIEKHHVLPRSLGGTDEEYNIVSLSAREHFVCHLLLTKMTVGGDKIKMCHAVGKFIQISPNQKRLFTSWEYKKIRETMSNVRVGKKHSIESRQKMSTARKGKSPWNKGVTGIVHSDESNKKRSATLAGKKKSDEVRQKMSQAKKGHKSGMTGKKHSEETIQRMKQSAQLRRVKTKE